MTSPSVTYTLSNGATADATQLNQNFTDLINGITDGTKDLSISALTCAGTATLNGHVNLGNSTADDLTITASLASTLSIKTTNTYNIGSATLGLAGAYFGTSSTQTARIVATSTLASSRTYTLLDAGAAANFVLSEGTATINGTKTFGGQLIAKGTATNDSAASGYIGEELFASLVTSLGTGLTTNTVSNVFNGGNTVTITLTAGDWDISGGVQFVTASAGTVSRLEFSVSKTSGTMADSSTTIVTPASAEYRMIDDRPIVTTNGNFCFSIPSYRASVSGSTQLWLVVRSLHTGGPSTVAANGFLRARRVR